MTAGAKKRWSNSSTENNIVCPSCGKQNFTDIREFNLMFKTFQGVTEDSFISSISSSGNCTRYFRKLQKRTDVQAVKKVPFGIGQIGKSFRNEITPGNFTHSVQENLNKWSLNFSVHRVQTLSGTHIGKNTV